VLVTIEKDGVNMSNLNLNRVFARSNARELTTEELQKVNGGSPGDSSCSGSTHGGGDHVQVPSDDVSVD